MYQVIIVFHVLFGLGIIGLVLMQQGKGADAGAAFGAGASGSVFGAQGAASFLSRSTAILATLFFISSLTLAVYNSHKGVAYDLMSGTESEEKAKEVSTLPDVEGARKAETAPVAPVAKPEETAPAPVPAAAEKPASTETKAAETPAPKAEAEKAAPAEPKKVEKPAAAPEAKKEAAKK